MGAAPIELYDRVIQEELANGRNRLIFVQDRAGERPRALHGGGIAVLALHRRLHQSGQFAQHWPLSDKAWPLAASLPALRTARVDPIVSLRQE